MEIITTRASRASAVALALALAVPAAATPGNGIRLGGSEGRLHPFLELEGRYDSNVYYTTDTKSVGDMILHVRPGFDLAVPGELTSVEAGGSLDWAQYLGLQNTETRSQLSKLYGQASLGVAVNRRGSVGLEVDDEFRRAQGTTALVLTNAVISNYNALRVRVPFRPGGGALTFTVNGGWTLETFENYFTGPLCATCGSNVGDLGYNEYRAGGELRWRFLPRTSAVLQGEWFNRDQKGTGSNNASGASGQAGVTGLVTAHLAATVKAGYGTTLGVTQGNLSTYLATVEAEWLATDTASVKAGWNHSLGLDPGPSPYKADHVYGGGKILLGGRYALRADVNWERRSYDFVLVSTTSAALAGASSADVLRLEPSFDAAITRWFTTSVGYAYSKRTSSFTTTIPGFDYSKNEAWLRLTFRY